MVETWFKLLPKWAQATILILIGPILAFIYFRVWNAEEINATTRPQFLDLHSKIMALETKHDTDMRLIELKSQLEMGFVSTQLSDIKTQINQLK